MYWVYVLKSVGNDRFYVGFSTNVEKRVKEHNVGKTRSTRAYKPWKLFFTERYESRLEARNREKYLKSGIGREYIRNKWSRSSIG